ncbi:ABC transporter ATP-binding protein [Paenibacillus sp. IB182496]|uniref:ABC transporter ATP-binding protein n=1 Tax=Paenibacillus sabuli TaxID=2772509 RepID=A0A927GQE0_9BACL|nr:ABC transporter ATP-binding protein [Paenibacillus sabuli]MBD2843662.1 ABC transporter ATP-binding protein [Paenibacillus sabuli]
MKSMIELRDIRKRYGATVAVDGVSLEVQKGEIFGIVGPNGAGKTTLIEILEGLRQADSGTAHLLGLDIAKQAAAIKQRIGVAFQATSVPPKARVGELVELFASFYSTKTDPERALRFFGLEERRRASFKSLSGGWKQRVALALAVVNDPEIVFLDEPSMGLDPTARGEMWQTIRRMRDEGRTIIVTTHYMEEAESLCDRVAVMRRGRIVAVDTPGALVAQLGGIKRIGFADPAVTSRDALAALPHVALAELERGSWSLHSSDMDQTLKALFRLADQEGWTVSGLRLDEASMNEVFRELTAEQMKEETQ